MLKKNILILLFSLGVMPALCMDAPLKLTQYQAIDDELVTVELQGGQLFKVQVRHAKLSQTLKNLIDDVGTDGILPIPNVNPAIWKKILELKPHLLDVTLEATNEQEKERNKSIIRDIIQSYDGATLIEFIKAVNYLDIPLLFELAVKIAKETGIKKITPEQIKTLPHEICNNIIVGQMLYLFGLPKQICRGHTDNVTSVGISADGNTIVSGSRDGAVRIWNRNGTQRALCKGHTKGITSVCISADGNTIVSGSNDHMVRIWNGNGTLRAVCEGHIAEVNSVCITPDGNTIVSGSVDSSLSIWNGDGTERAICSGHTNNVTSVGISADGNTIVSGSWDHTIRIWNGDGSERAVCNGHTLVVKSVSMSADGNTIVSGSWDQSVRIWNSNGTQRAVCRGHTGTVASVGISVDGQTIVSRSTDQTVRIWNGNGIQRNRINNKKYGFGSMCVSQNGKLVVGNSDGTICTSDSSGTVIGEYKNYHARNVTALCISPDNNIIVSGSEDRNVHIYDCQLGKNLKNINKEQALGVWVFLQEKLAPLLETGLVKADTNNCWRHIKAIMEVDNTKTVHAKFDGSEPATKRQKSDE